MRRIALMNQKGGVGKTTSAVNLGAGLALAGRRVVLIDLDPQGNLSLHLDAAIPSEQPTTYSVLLSNISFKDAIRPTSTPGLSLVGANIDLSGAEMELASTLGRETLMRDALDAWEKESIESTGESPADYVLLDCPPSLGLLSINGLVAANEVVIALQTEFFALQGMSKLTEVIQLLQRRLNPHLSLRGILPCLYDSRLRLAREVLAEIRTYFPDSVFPRPIGKNIKLAEAPGHGKTIFEYAPESAGAVDYRAAAEELLAQEPESTDDTQEAADQPAQESGQESEAPDEMLREVVATPGRPLEEAPAPQPDPDSSGGGASETPADSLHGPR